MQIAEQLLCTWQGDIMQSLWPMLARPQSMRMRVRTGAHKAVPQPHCSACPACKTAGLRGSHRGRQSSHLGREADSQEGPRLQAVAPPVRQSMTCCHGMPSLSYAQAAHGCCTSCRDAHARRRYQLWGQSSMVAEPDPLSSLSTNIVNGSLHLFSTSR